MDRSLREDRRAPGRRTIAEALVLAAGAKVKTSKLGILLAAAAFTFSLSPAAATGDRGRLCEREMALAAQKHGVPLGMLYAVGLTETGRGDSLRPYALNIDGRADLRQRQERGAAPFEDARGGGRAS